MSDEFKDYVLDQLSTIDGITSESMFGGWGMYYDDFFFGIAYKGELYFKTDEATRRDYVQAGMKPFSPNPKVTLRDYYQVPVEVLENRDKLTRWARNSFGIQRS